MLLVALHLHGLKNAIADVGQRSLIIAVDIGCELFTYARMHLLCLLEVLDTIVMLRF